MVMKVKLRLSSMIRICRGKKKLKGMENKKTIIVGDIHGCIDEFNELLNTVSYNKENDRVILLGDLIDRGPDSIGVIRKACEMNLECVMGNHEHKFLKWFRSTGSSVDVYDMHPHYKLFSDQDINYITRMPDYIKLDNAMDRKSTRLNS